MSINDHNVESAYNATALKILSTAAHLFMQLGYRAVSINDIVTAAEVTKPTLYYYFPDKAELFTQMALQKLVAMHAAIDAALASAGGIAAQLTALAQTLLDTSDGDMRMLRHEMSEHLDQAHQDRLSQAFQLHLFMPIYGVMQQAIERGDLSNHSAGELTMLFLGLTEAFHGYAGQIDTTNMPPQLGQFRSHVFSAGSLVGMFLNGVSSNAERGTTQ